MFPGRPGEERPGVCFVNRLRALLPGEGVSAPPGAPPEVMDVSPQDPPLVAMDLSKRYNAQSRSRPEALDLAKKPEWYHRRPPGGTGEPTPPSNSNYRTRSAYNSLSSEPEPHGGCMNSTLLPHLDLYHEDVHTNMWHSGFYGTDQSGGPAPESSGGEESDSGSDVIFLVSSTKEPLICGSFIQDDMRHIVEPLSPAASSLDEDAACYHIPEPLSSPSPDSSFSEESSDSSLDIPAHHTRPLVLLSDLGSLYSSTVESVVEASSDDSDVIVVHDGKKHDLQSPPPGTTERRKTSRRGVRRSSRIVPTAPEAPLTPCSASRYSLRRRAKNNAVGIYNESCDSEDMMEFAMRVSSSDESVKRPKRSLQYELDVQSDDTSPGRKQQQQQQQTEKMDPVVKKPLSAPEAKKPRGTKQKENCKEQQSPKQQQETQRTSKGGDTTVRKKPPPRRRRKRRPCNGPSALFSPREPEINLKVLRIKEEKKEKKSSSFCPFVRMEQSTCTVFNFQEDAAAANRSNGVDHTPASKSARSGFVPSTSCFRLSRTASDTPCADALRCCLCGQTANVLNLGDLHGPYCAQGVSLHRTEDESQEAPNLPQGNPSHSTDSSCSPTVPLPPDECWIHEDCGVWCTGIFLVRGRLYGLREAARLAQETVCSGCRHSGAIMGCFQKGCSRSYHYRCAIQSGCFLNEDNFSMRCPDHKLKALPNMKVRR